MRSTCYSMKLWNMYLAKLQSRFCLSDKAQSKRFLPAFIDISEEAAEDCGPHTLEHSVTIVGLCRQRMKNCRQLFRLRKLLYQLLSSLKLEICQGDNSQTVVVVRTAW